MNRLFILPVLFLTLLMGNPAFSTDYQKGMDAAKRGDHATALREWTPLAEQGFAHAQHSLGVMYEKGQGVPRDYETAIKWFKLAAEQGLAPAQYNLGVMYENGQGVPRDYKTAVKWHTLAAEQGLGGKRMRFPTPIRGIAFFLMVAVVCVTANPLNMALAQDINEAQRLRQEGEQAVLSRDYAEAEPILRRLLAIQEKTVGLEHNDAVRTLFFLGASLAGQGRKAEAEALNSRSKSLALLYALNYGQKDRALALLQQGANPNVHDARGRTALMYAGSAGQTLLLKKLLERGADVHARMLEEGTTALMAAINHGDPVAIRLLLSKGVDVNAKNAKGQTALAWAHKRLSMAPTERKFGRTTLPKRLPYGDLTAATREEFEDIIELLKKAGAGN